MDWARKYLETELFRRDESGHPLFVRKLRAIARTHVLAVRGFVQDGIFHHASALAFDTVLALLPMLIIVFAMLRGLGAYDAFLSGTVRPWIEHTFGPAATDRATMREAVLELLALGEEANVGALGAVGVALLLYLVVILLMTVENTFNRFWGVPRPRSFVRKATDYAAILFLMPFAILFANTIAQAIGQAVWLGPAQGFVEAVASVLAAAAALTVLYLIMPHTSVRVWSAAYGGLVAGVLWALVLWSYTTFQIGVARYNALYSSFAAIPLFLVWVFVSWVVVLYGAEVAAAHQNPSSYRWRIRHRDPSASTRHRLALRFAEEVAHAFVNNEPPPTLGTLSQLGRVPEGLAREILDDLVTAGLLTRALVGNEGAYVLARDPTIVRVSDVLGAVDHTEDPQELLLEAHDEEAERLAVVLARLGAASEGSGANLDLRSLVEEVRESAEITRQSGANLPTHSA